MKAGSRRQIWRLGVSLSVTEIEDSGLRFYHQHINPPAGSNRFRAAVGAPLIQWVFRVVVGLIAAPIAVAAIIKWLGLP
jgi:hypothetical protein